MPRVKFNVVINTDCEGICYRIYGRQKFQIMPEHCQAEGIIKEFLPGVYPVTNARAWGIYYYYKDRPTWFQEISLYFYEVTRTSRHIVLNAWSLIKADDFTTNIQSCNRNSTSIFQRAVIACFTPPWFYPHRQVFIHCALPVFIMGFLS